MVEGNVIVSGASGFTGRHLVALLRGQPQISVRGLGVHADRSYQTEAVDLSDYGRTQEAITKFRPTAVIHLAGRIRAGSPRELYAANIIPALNLIEALPAGCGEVRFLNVGSSAQYGGTTESRAIDEDHPLEPVSHYGRSKLAQEQLVLQYCRSDGLPVIAVRTFNLIGPGQPPVLAHSAFAQQVAEIEAGLRPPIVHTGRLDTRRDFVDVRDAVRAYAVLLHHGTPGEAYNVCSGVDRAVGDCIDILRDLSSTAFRVVTDNSRIRMHDVLIQRGSPDKLHALTGWKAEIPLENSLRDLLHYWRTVVAAKGKPFPSQV